MKATQGQWRIDGTWNQHNSVPVSADIVLVHDMNEDLLLRSLSWYRHSNFYGGRLRKTDMLDSDVTD